MNYKTILVCLFTIALGFASIDRAAAQNTTPTLAVSWNIAFLSPGPSATSAASAVEGLITFTSDGSAIETDASEVSPGPGPSATGGGPIASAVIIARAGSYGTPGHGIWQAGPALGNYYIQFVSLFVNATGIVQSRKTVTITGALDSTGNHFTGNYNAQSVDKGGAVIGALTGTVSATRMTHPLLPAAIE